MIQISPYTKILASFKLKTIRVSYLFITPILQAGWQFYTDQLPSHPAIRAKIYEKTQALLLKIHSYREIHICELRFLSIIRGIKEIPKIYFIILIAVHLHIITGEIKSQHKCAVPYVNTC